MSDEGFGTVKKKSKRVVRTPDEDVPSQSKKTKRKSKKESTARSRAKKVAPPSALGNKSQVREYLKHHAGRGPGSQSADPQRLGEGVVDYIYNLAQRDNKKARSIARIATKIREAREKSTLGKTLTMNHIAAAEKIYASECGLHKIENIIS